jgi:hypothetical protein
VGIDSTFGSGHEGIADGLVGNLVLVDALGMSR